MNRQRNTPDVQMDAGSLYREDVFTDNRVGTIRQLTPVDTTGARDARRAVEYVGSTQIMTPAGALPLTFMLEADNLAEAVKQFGEATQTAMQETMDELKEMQRQAASGIVVPKGRVDPAALGNLGGGKIQMP